MQIFHLHFFLHLGVLKARKEWDEGWVDCDASPGTTRAWSELPAGGERVKFEISSDGGSRQVCSEHL